MKTTSIIRVEDFDENLIKNCPLCLNPRGRQGSFRKRRYKNIVCAFDIETSTDVEKELTWLYHWQFQFGDFVTVIGRTWDEFMKLCRKIKECMNTNEYLMIFVHNLSYEFQFLSGIYQFKKEEVFATDSRKILYCRMLDCLEFRCSYKLTNMSLALATKKYHCEHAKLDSDDYNHAKLRYPDTEIKGEELEYCQNDVLGLVELIDTLNESEGDTLTSMPYTSTGYVRRDIKKSCEKIYPALRKLKPSKEVYQMLKRAFRGGDTHANRYASNRIIRGEIEYWDRASSYPDVQINCKFPVTEFKRLGEIELDYALELMDKKNYALLMDIEILELDIGTYPNPYLSYDKLTGANKIETDNGRVLSGEFVKLSVTDIDLRIILETYKIEGLRIKEAYYSRYNKLPKQVLDVVRNYFNRKTQLKDVEGQEIMYMKSKNKLNSIYGNSAQDMVHDEIEYKRGSEKVFEKKDKHTDEVLTEIWSKIGLGTLPYQWGVWTTAHARNELYRGQKNVIEQGGELIYWDTDSIIYRGNVDWTEINERYKSLSQENDGSSLDVKGVRRYLGVYEKEKIKITTFKTMGAKKYCYLDSENKLHLTVSGVTKKGDKGAKELGKIENFREGFVFREAGGVCLKYKEIDKPYKTEHDGHIIEVCSYVAILPSTYELGITGNYSELLEKISENT